ncbi:MAG: hypothetical protein HYX27_27700 [Acidobacteria bacterium]|nr:hypothetical protein [Acidobacteriota bacterium]
MAEQMPPEEIAKHATVLNDGRDAEPLAVSAVALAESETRDAILTLARALRVPGFLARLEGSDGETTNDATNLADVFIALTEHPTDASGRLCELIYSEESFRELPARINPLLRALGAVKPVTPRAAEIFRETSAAGFAQVNGPILIGNGEPVALAIFAEIISGDWVESYVKVDILHRSILAVRDRVPIIQMCDRLLRSNLDEEVCAGIAETLYDYRSKDWFGPAMYAPKPPDWNQAPDAALEALLRLGEWLLHEKRAARVLVQVRGTCEQLKDILRGRHQ